MVNALATAHVWYILEDVELTLNGYDPDYGGLVMPFSTSYLRRLTS
jgi:hypothetical protein